MNVANLELCKELYEVSGWGDDCEHHWIHHDLYDRMPHQSDLKTGQTEDDYAPAYDLGYLLRKLPADTGIEKMYKPKDQEGYFYISYLITAKNSHYESRINCGGDTPEEATCRLAIELFEQGILTKETN